MHRTSEVPISTQELAVIAAMSDEDYAVWVLLGCPSIEYLYTYLLFTEGKVVIWSN